MSRKDDYKPLEASTTCRSDILYLVKEIFFFVREKSGNFFNKAVCGNLVSVGWLLSLILSLLSFGWWWLAGGGGEGGFSLFATPRLFFSSIFCTAPAERIDHPRVDVMMSLITFSLGKWTNDTRIMAHKPRKILTLEAGSWC